MTDQTGSTIRNDQQAGRYEAVLDGHTATLNYNLTDNGIVVASTVTPAQIQGRGVAGALFRAVLDDARTDGRRVIPVCPVFAVWLRRHPEAHDLIDPGFRRSLGLSPQ